MHCAYPMWIAGSEEQQQRYLPGLNRGELYGSLAVTEPDAGSDISRMRTTARRDGDAYILDGTKTFITTGDRADVIIVFARTDPDRGRDGISAFIVERGAPGLHSGRILDKLGMHGSSTAELHFDRCRIPASRRLGREGSGYELSLRSVTKSRVSAAAQGLGLARGAYEGLLRLARSAALCGRGRRDTQDLQFAVADMRTRIAAARALLHAAARSVHRCDREPTAAVAMAKTTCTDLAVSVADQCVDLVGVDGDLVELEFERYLRDAKVTQIYDGRNQIQRMLIARDIRARLEEER
jgi:alkylation response protein AidB-like acyl-CoA dehydrogenase